MAIYCKQKNFAANTIQDVWTTSENVQLMALRVTAPAGIAADCRLEIRIYDGSVESALGSVFLPQTTNATGDPLLSAEFIMPYCLIPNGFTLRVKSSASDSLNVVAFMRSYV